ncbi:MAG: YggT family protein [Gammaproteobacteria bacterium]|nr:YggT family protein [Gammaproteobacteria bacterium]
MTAPYLSNAGTFLVSTLFGLYILAVMLRFLLQCIRADFYNPIAQFLIAITNPPLRPLRRVLPGYGGIDWPSIVLMVALKALEISLIALLATGHIPQLSGLLVLSFADLMSLLVYVFLIAIIIQVILSWVNPGAYNPATLLLDQLTEPLLAPARRILPPIGGLDLSPILVLIALQLLMMLLIAPLADIGGSLL